ncbi:hypothetical protein ASG01_04555 [Chryseobacterium sp. Leaf180]|uniref:hypothetical protein n=1 Tax=Chryseobacterium sp. Leaf180 TaxID=1736289 RepID=UPI0007000B62|nr:hypothetical protein [Chryseobacterium sp. Leaf180]KQR95129.1 hypothetical protein ASG01_04555 [Chryseobacterium sp. Leaf180]
MSKIILIFFVSFFSAQQSCKISFKNSVLSDDGIIKLIVTEIGGKKVKVPQIYSSIWARPIELQVFNDVKNDYVTTDYIGDDVDCFNNNGCFGKMFNLKKGNSKEYRIKIIPGSLSRGLKYKKIYRFKLAFDTSFLKGCNDYVTDWRYYDNKNK